MDLMLIVYIVYRFILSFMNRNFAREICTRIVQQKHIIIVTHELAQIKILLKICPGPKYLLRKLCQPEAVD